MSSAYGRETHKTRRVYLHLRDRLVSGEIPVGGRLPSEAELCRDYEVARTTVRQALNLLVQDGLVQKRMGAGSFACGNPASHGYIQGDIANAIRDLQRMGRNSTVALIAFGYQEALPEVRSALDLDAGELVQRSVRVRSMDGQPFSWLVAQVPERFGRSFEPAELETATLLSLLQRAGLEPASATQEISAVLASPDMATGLDTDVGSPLLALTRVVRGADGRGIEYLQAYYRPDRYRLRMDLTRSPDRAEWRPD